MDHVYVVTYGLKGAREGEFHSEMAYVNIEGADVASFERRKILGEVFDRVSTNNPAHQHVVKQWDSRGKYGMTVRLERLEVQE